MTPKEINLKSENPTKEVNEFDVLLVRAVKSQFDGQEKVETGLEDLVGAYYIPAKLNENGVLKQHEQKLLWIPREFLKPMVVVELALGETAEYRQ